MTPRSILSVTIISSFFCLAWATESDSSIKQPILVAQAKKNNQRNTGSDSICRGYKIPEAQIDSMKKKKGCKIRGPFQGEIQTKASNKKGTHNLEKALAACIKQNCAGISADWYIDGTWTIHKKLSRGGFRSDENSYGCTFLVTGC